MAHIKNSKQPISDDPVSAEPLASDDTELAKHSQNQVTDLIDIPFQNYMNFDLEPNRRTQNVLNIQPVIPFNLTDD